MNVLIVGANGYLGPHVVEALAPPHHLRVTDIKPPLAEAEKKFHEHEFLNVDVTSPSQVMDAALVPAGRSLISATVSRYRSSL